jgi:hypothetical protein
MDANREITGNQAVMMAKMKVQIDALDAQLEGMKDCPGAMEACIGKMETG